MGVVTNGAPAAVEAPQPLAANLAWLLSQASYALATQITAALQDLGVSPRAHCVLSTALTGELTQTELANAVGLDKTTMVVTVDELEAAGLAERRPSKTDRRARVIAVTKAGAKKVDQAAGVVELVQAEALASLVCQLGTPVECGGVRRREPRG